MAKKTITLKNFKYDPSIDYQSEYELLPIEIKELALSEDYVTEEYDTSADLSAKLLKEVEKKGWTFDYNFMGEIYSLRPIGEPEQEFSKGGEIGAKVGKLLKSLEKAFKDKNGEKFNSISDEIHRISDNEGLTKKEYDKWDSIREKERKYQFDKFGSTYAEGGEIKNHSDIVNLIEDSNTYMTLYDEVEKDLIMYSTRENGNIGEELASDKDVDEAIRLKRIVESKFNNVVVEVEEVDEWVHLNIRPIQKATYRYKFHKHSTPSVSSSGFTETYDTMNEMIKKRGTFVGGVNWEKVKKELENIIEYPNNKFTGWYDSEPILISKPSDNGNDWGYFFSVSKSENKNEYSKGGSTYAEGGEIKTFEKELKSNGFDFARYPNPNGYLLLVDDLKERSPYEIEETINSISSKLGVSDQVLLPQVTKSIGFKIVYDTDKSYAEGGEIEDLKLKRLKLLNKAFKMMPNSPKQLKVREEIADLDTKISQLKGGSTSYAEGGEITSYGLSFSKTDYNVNVNPQNLEVDVNIEESDSVDHYGLNDTDAEWTQYQWGYMVYPKSVKQLYNVLKALRCRVSKKRLEEWHKKGGQTYAEGGEVKFRKLAKSKNFDIVTPDGRFEIEMGAFGMPKSIIVGDTRKDINTSPIAKKYQSEIQSYLDANYEKGGSIKSNWFNGELSFLNW